MRMSYAIPHSNGRFYLPSRVREWLQLPRQCLLHGRLVDDADETAMILSPIPTEDWTRCFRVIINTCSRVGSLHDSLEAMQRQELNILHMVAAAASAKGELSITAIVAKHDSEASRSNRKQLRPEVHPEVVATQIASKVSAELAKRRRLSESSLYLDGSLTKLKLVRASPLLVLKALGEAEPSAKGLLRDKLGREHRPEFALNVARGAIDLNTVSLLSKVHKPTKQITLFNALQSYHLERSVSMVITADPDDYHFRISFLPPRRYMQIDVALKVEPKANRPALGITREIVGAFGNSPCPVNVFFSNTDPCINPRLMS